MKITTITKHFNELSTSELYAILNLRNEVFIVEQQCVYLDVDHKDLNCYHLCLYDNNILAGYSRILPKGLSYEDVSFGRVVISPKYRGKGLGKTIVQETLNACEKLFGNVQIKIGAQLYLLDLYKFFNFEAINEPYDEDGITHIDMIKKIQ